MKPMTPKNDTTIIDLGIALSMPEPTEVMDQQHQELSRWIGLAAAGDLSAFESIVRRFEHRVLLTSERMLGNVEDAQDAAQETFIRVYRNLSRVDRSRRFEPWLYRIAVNVCRDAWKRRKRHAEVPLPQEGEQPDPGRRGDPHRTLRAREDQRMLYDALATIPEKERAAIVLRDIEGFSTAEVADILRSSEGTVRSQVSTARVKIKKALEGKIRRVK